jgi:3-dehydroquinate synthase
VSDRLLEILSHKGRYVARFQEGCFSDLIRADLSKRVFIVDSKVARLYAKPLERVLTSGSCLQIEATEENKSLDRFPGYIQELVSMGIRRGDTLVAVGGGIIQDITCFLAATVFRGLDWIFYPTTLLAQSDSCIGSKSSINVGALKNLLGTFTPPKEVWIDPLVLKTLSEAEICSGIGEMLKIHIIDGPASFDQIAADYDRILRDPACLLHTVQHSLEIKKRFIEVDEFDRGIRNVLNYGHSFGHAIEAATEFGVPHGIAVTLGMDLANYVAMRLGVTSLEHFERMHPVLRKNYLQFEKHPVPFDGFLNGLSKDKKNSHDQLGLILPAQDGIPARGFYSKDARFIDCCEEYFAKVRLG